jgi:hypothetical protein
MTIDNHCGQDDHQFPGSQAEAHSQLALEQSALYEAQLAIARWINSSTDVRAPIEPPAPALARAAWFAEAQHNFQKWLGCGGFSQYEVAASDISEPPVGLYFPAGKPPAIPGLFRSDTCVD